jgi:transposase
MDLAGYVVNAVLVEGQGVDDVCAAHGISRRWLYELIGRYREDGEPPVERLAPGWTTDVERR